MSTEAISFYLSSRLGTGSFAFYYDFENYDGNYIVTTGSPEYPTFIKYSGKIEGDVSAFKDTAFGSGAFNLNEGDNNYIKIENILPDDDLMSRDGFTFLVSQEKIDNSCGTIFSNFAGSEYTTSGWEFGINNANQLYFKYQDALMGGDLPGSPYSNIITLNTIPASKNFYAVTFAGGQVSVGRYVPDDGTWEISARSVNTNYIRNNKDWYIGKGEYEYVGYMDKFAFFNTPVSFSDLGGIINASYQEVETGHGAESITISGNLTGYEGYPSGTTGVLVSSGELSGYREVITSGSNPFSEPLFGDVLSGSGYYEPSLTYTGSGNALHPESGQFYIRKLASEDLTEIVTGFNTGRIDFEDVSEVAVYQDVDITGITSTGSGHIPLYEDSRELVLTDGITVLSGSGIDADYSYNYNYLSYQGQRGGGTNIYDGEEGDFVEYLLNVEPNTTNFTAGYGFSPQVGYKIFHIDSEYSNEDEAINVFTNGVYQTTGQKVEGPPDPTNPLNPNESTFSIEDGNYVLNGIVIEPANSYYFNKTDSVIYDVDQGGEEGRLDITDVAQYDGAPFPEIGINNSIIFFNGQEIYEGIDWIDSGGFTPIGDITSMIGTYISKPSYETPDTIIELGINLYDIENPYGNNFIAFINGVRTPKDSFFYYSTGVSLLTADKNVVELPLKTLYHITAYNTFF